MNHNLEMIYGNQADPSIQCAICDSGEADFRCVSCEGYCNYTAKEETDNQKITKEDSVSTLKGAVDGSAPTFTCLCPGCGLRFGKECPVTKLAEALEHALEVIV